MILMNGLRGGQRRSRVIGIRRVSYLCSSVFVRGSCSSVARMYFTYSVLIVLFFVVMSPSLIYQAVRHRKYIGSLTQRLGYLPISFNLDSDQSIWIHAVSVGEVLTARALLPDLRERYPKLRLFLSTTTMTGQQI